MSDHSDIHHELSVSDHSDIRHELPVGDHSEWDDAPLSFPRAPRCSKSPSDDLIQIATIPEFRTDTQLRLQLLVTEREYKLLIDREHKL